jgi:hypothetical protein
MCDEFDTSCVAAANDAKRRASYGVVMTTITKGGVMKVKGSRRLVARLGLALAVAAIAAPGAQAMRMNAVSDSGGSARLYADDLHAPLAVATLKASNVRTDAASLQPIVSGSNVRTDAASLNPRSGSLVNDFIRIDVRTDSASLESSVPGSNVRTDAASSKPTPVPVSSFASNVRTDGASSVPITDARHSALLRHRAQVGQQPTQFASTQLPSTDSPGINWGVAAIGAALGALGLMLLFSVVFFAGRHNRRGRLAAT